MTVRVEVRVWVRFRVSVRAIAHARGAEQTLNRQALQGAVNLGNVAIRSARSSRYQHELFWRILIYTLPFSLPRTQLYIHLFLSFSLAFFWSPRSPTRFSHLLLNMPLVTYFLCFSNPPQKLFVDWLQSLLFFLTFK